MNGTKQAVWLFVALISLACSGWYFGGASPISKLDDQTLSNTADITVHHLTVRQYDTEGKLTHYLQTPLMHHIPLNNTHWFKTPHIMVSQQNQPAWDIHAQQATALNGGQKITFNNKVVAHQQQDEHTQESTLETEEMSYFPKDKLAMTLLEVTYKRAGTTVQSTGMKAYLAEKRVKLLSQARGTYVPDRG